MIVAAPGERVGRVTEYLYHRFGLAHEIFRPYEFLAGSNGRILLASSSVLRHLDVDTCGLLIARIHRTVKPTTNLFQIFGTHVTRNTITLPKDLIPAFCRGDDIDLHGAEITTATRGYVMVIYKNLPLGCGLLKDNIIYNQVPKPNRLELRYW